MLIGFVPLAGAAAQASSLGKEGEAQPQRLGLRSRSPASSPACPAKARGLRIVQADGTSARGMAAVTKKTQANSGSIQRSRTRIVNGVSPTTPGRIAMAAVTALNAGRLSRSASLAEIGAATSA